MIKNDLADSPSTDVLVIGAGPTGLVLALWLTRLGVRVRIVDKSAEAGRTSRAVGVQARTLEFYKQIGLADRVVGRGVRCTAANVWVRGALEGRLGFGDAGKQLTPFPYMLVYPQDEHENLLVEELAKSGVRVERSTELVAFEEAGERVVARLRGPDGNAEPCDARFLAGCDGAHSRVRRGIGADFAGGTYAHVFYVADVDAAGPPMNGEIHIALDDGDFFACFPLEGRTRARLIGAILDRSATDRDGAALEWNDVDKRALERMKLDVARVNWFSTYRVHHRVASTFRAGRAFVLGDAAHVHSPVGGQGMNTGIGDAVNLAWKLAAVVRGKARPDLLDSYEEERMPFARRLVKTTDRVFSLVTAKGAVANAIRLDVAAPLLTRFFRSERVRRLAFQTISQTTIRYRGARLSEGRAGRVHGGDRLPWIPLDVGGDDPDGLTSLDWQVHVHGEAPAALRVACQGRRLPLHVFPWGSGAKAAGIARDGAYLVRPDGYVALATAGAGASARIEAYFAARGLEVG